MLKGMAYRRIRNRIIEHLQFVSSAEKQLAYQQKVPVAHVSNELFNAWTDWVANEQAIEQFVAPIFSSDEQQAIVQFNSTLDMVARQTPQELAHITEFIGTPAWEALSSAARSALAVFQLRGMSPEHQGAMRQRADG